MPPADLVPGRARTASSTARPAESGANVQGLDPALVRIAINGLVTLSAAAGKPMTRKDARKVVRSYADAHGPSLDGWAHWLRNNVGVLDPTGETARRKVDGGWS